MRFRFRKVLDNKFHPEWDNQFWENSPWTGIIACPFSSIVENNDSDFPVGFKRPLEGIYFESGSSAYGGTMHTIMGRSGHFLKAEKGETLRAALLTPNGTPWETKFKGYLIKIGIRIQKYFRIYLWSRCLARISSKSCQMSGRTFQWLHLWALSNWNSKIISPNKRILAQWRCI